MKNLAECLEELNTHILQWGGKTGSWSAVGIVEETDIRRERQVCHIAQVALFSPENYTPRFDVLLKRGYSWLNMNAAGIVDYTLIVVIELPSYVTEIIGKTSVNYLGPSIISGKPQWDATGLILLQ